MKAGGFFLNVIIGGNIFVASMYMTEHSKKMTVLGAGIVIGGYVLSIMDTNLSAKKINQQKLRAHKHKHVRSAPPQILIGSYNIRF